MTMYIVYYPSKPVRISSPIWLTAFRQSLQPGPNRYHTTSHLPSPVSNTSLGVYSAVLYWSMLEIGLSLIAACLPTLGPLFRFRQRRRRMLSYYFSVNHRSRHRQQVAESTSEEKFVPNEGRPGDVGVEAVVEGDAESTVRPPGGRILVRQDVFRWSSSEKSLV